MAIVEIHGGPITHRYLMGKTKDELARMYMQLLRETDQDAKDAEKYRAMQPTKGDGQAGWQGHPDTERLNFIEGEFLAVEAVAVRASEDDADVAWVISQDHMRQGKVVLHRSHDDNLRRAIDAVMQPNKGEGEGVSGRVCPRAEHCQTGRADICLASQRDGVICPDDECDIDTGQRFDHTKQWPTKGEGE